MKTKISILLLLLCFTFNSQGANYNTKTERIVDGVKYSLKGNEVSCKAAISKNEMLFSVIIREKVNINGNEYKVTKVAKNAFKNCKNLQSVIIPNSVTQIGEDAFKDCVSLEEIIMPDEAHIVLTQGNYGFGGKGPFSGCKKLSKVRGNTIKYPDYILSDAFYRCEEVPFFNQIPDIYESANRYEKIAMEDKIIEKPENQPQVKQSHFSPIDSDIPVTGVKNNKTFVVAIGNEDYQLVEDVPFASNDLDVFIKYCNKTLGVPQQNIRSYKNATYGNIIAAMKDIKDIANAYNGAINIIFYYTGHGMPDEKSHDPHLVPVDASDVNTGTWYALRTLYDELEATRANSVVVFLDACFSGSARGEKMLAQGKGIVIRYRDVLPKGNTIAITASEGKQSAHTYTEKGHSVFTYFLLEKLQETKGNVTISELTDYIKTNVTQQSVVVNRRIQTPTLLVSPDIKIDWENIKLR